MNENSFVPVSVGKFDPDRVKCAMCGNVGPIEERAQFRLTVMGKPSCNVYYCRKCFGFLIAA